MTLSHDEEDNDLHPYWYGRLLRIYHIVVLHTGSQSKSQDPQTFQVLCVHWFGMDPKYVSG